MYPAFKKFMLVLAVLAVGVVQLFGTPLGYLCGCTGDWSQDAVCEPVACHPVATTEQGTCGSPCADNPASSDCPQHEHNEVRGTLPMTAAVSLPSLPSPVFLEIPDLLQPPIQEVAASDQAEKVECPRSADDRSPPTAIVATRTTVMLV